MKPTWVRTSSDSSFTRGVLKITKPPDRWCQNALRLPSGRGGHSCFNLPLLRPPCFCFWTQSCLTLFGRDHWWKGRFWQRTVERWGLGVCPTQQVASGVSDLARILLDPTLLPQWFWQALWGRLLCGSFWQSQMWLVVKPLDQCPGVCWKSRIQVEKSRINWLVAKVIFSFPSKNAT